MDTDKRIDPLTGSRSLPAGAFPLSAVQRSMWFAQQLHPTVPYFIAQYIEFHGDLDMQLLSRAAVEAAHEFRITVSTVDVPGWGALPDRGLHDRPGHRLLRLPRA